VPPGVEQVEAAPLPGDSVAAYEPLGAGGDVHVHVHVHGIRDRPRLSSRTWPEIEPEKRLIDMINLHACS
jgi:hypothetical protein